MTSLVDSSLPLHEWRWIIVNSSAGKDSQTALHHVVAEADRQGYDRRRIVVSHQCLGRYEWPGTFDLVHVQAEQYGLRTITASYRNKDGEYTSLLDYVRKRGKWPDSRNRYCTSEFKRGPGGRVITQLFNDSPGPILNVFGFRSQESPARAARHTFSLNKRFSTRHRLVHDWLPIHHLSTDQVWDDIRSTKIPYHYAYDLGLPRVSCPLCIFAPEWALIRAGRALPDLLDDYISAQDFTRHLFREDTDLHEIRNAILNSADPPPTPEPWNL